MEIHLAFLCIIATVVAGQQLPPPNCPDRGEVICLGHSASRSQSASGSTVAEILQDAYNDFCGCRYIQDNVVITTPSGLPDYNQPLIESNFSFLYHIKEISGYLELSSIPNIPRVSLPNLRIIRGNILRSSQFGLVVSGKIQSLYMPMLTEVSQGSVLIRGDSNEPTLCNVNSINWTDIAPYNPSNNRIITNGCTNEDYIDCNDECSSGFCWCDDTNSSNMTCCQLLTLNCDCNGERCFRNNDNQTGQCCHAQCAAGCFGNGNADQCQACKNVLSNEKCNDRCPERLIYDPKTQTIINNPDFGLEARPLCVTECPNMMYELDDTSCVEECPNNYMSIPGTRKCIRCNGECPQECAGGVFQYNGERPFQGCEIITGTLKIGALEDSPLLNDLLTVKEIRGSLDISSFNGRNFPYLSNLRFIGTDYNHIRLLSCNVSDINSRSPITINIANTALESIDLSSLESVNGGGVKLVNNPSLCYLGNLSYFMTNSSFSSCVLEGHRRSEEECVLANLTCHSDCSSERGWCWGPNETQCVSCNEDYFKYERQCVSTCNNFTVFGVHLYESSDDNRCLPCHSLCNDSCTGEGPDHCNDCSTGLFVPVTTGRRKRCLEKCLSNTYQSHTGECLPCFEGCVQGCTGPQPIMNTTNGCNKCNTVLLNRNGEQLQCQLDQVNCPLGYYRELLISDRDIFTANTVLCHSCYELCNTCTGPLVSDCLECTYNRNDNGSCDNYTVVTSLESMSTLSLSPSNSPLPTLCKVPQCDICNHTTTNCCTICLPGYILNECTCENIDLTSCNNETITTSRGYFDWPETVANSTVLLSCPNGPNGSIASRICTADLNWELPNIDSCATTEITNRFLTLSQTNITIDNVLSVSQNLTDLVNKASRVIADQNIDNLKIVSTILTQTAALLSDDSAMPSFSLITKTTKDTFVILDTVEEWPQEIVQTHSNQIVRSLEVILDVFVRQENFTDIVIMEHDITFKGKRIQRNDFNGVTFTASSLSNTSFNNNETELATISIPASILNITKGDNINFVFTIYTQALLFPIRGEVTSNRTLIGSSVIGASIEGLLNGITLIDPVIITLALTTIDNYNITNPLCVFWDFTAAAGQGNWSTEGCITDDSDLSAGSVKCLCNHLTNFAILVDISSRNNRTPLPNSYIVTLEVVTYIGVCLSLLGLMLTILTLLLFKKIRQRDVTKFHLQFCISLICLLVVFVAGIDRVSIREGCITVGVLIHYFTLVSWMWMGAEALLMFQKVIIVFTDITWCYVIAVSFICWTVPLLPVVIILSINIDFYISSDDQTGFCFLSNLIPFLAGFLLPIMIVIIFNIIVYIIAIRVSILHTVKKNNRLGKSTLISRSEAFKLILSFTGIMILFGITWIFGALTFITEPSVSFVVQLVFAFFNSFQGFFIFVFFVLLNNDSKDSWKSLLCSWSVRDKKNFKSSPQYTVYASHKESFDSGYGYDKNIELTMSSEL